MRGLYEHSSKIIPRSALELPLIAGRELDVKPIPSSQIFLNSWFRDLYPRLFPRAVWSSMVYERTSTLSKTALRPSNIRVHVNFKKVVVDTV